MINFHDSTFDLIEAYQFVQDNDGKAECRLRASRRLDAADIADIASALYSKTGDSIIWSVCQDVPFELTPRGKCKTVVQRVPKNRSIS